MTPFIECNLAALETSVPGLTNRWGKFLCEASAVSFVTQQHSTGVELEVSGTKPATFRVYWDNEVDQATLDAWSDHVELVEYGAYGVAIVLILRLTHFTAIRKACRGPGFGFDYWLTRSEIADPFQGAARLEVSGILRGDAHALAARVNVKKKQMEGSDHIPGYVAVVEFGTPRSAVVEK